MSGSAASEMRRNHRDVLSHGASVDRSASAGLMTPSQRSPAAIRRAAAKRAAHATTCWESTAWRCSSSPSAVSEIGVLARTTSLLLTCCGLSTDMRYLLLRVAGAARERSETGRDRLSACSGTRRVLGNLLLFARRLAARAALAALVRLRAWPRAAACCAGEAAAHFPLALTRPALRMPSKPSCRDCRTEPPHHASDPCTGAIHHHAHHRPDSSATLSVVCVSPACLRL